ncbi:phenazine biosynthesis protein PhzF [Clostridium isatidis]|uniref:Phenazine biosynthesis protein PhzF n=2 Tax=Clostridium isatidis TaxID=182773 RepID=A0A343JEI7_9CLOT|nr:phenazine biosynthesis protein PhzF [Clostridium isatidis]
MGDIMNRIKIYQVDAFTDEVFKGNPAGVCILEEELNEELMKNIAQEMNLSETAFVRPIDTDDIGSCSLFSLRWFTPEVEVDLCGHGTIAASKVLFEEYNFKAKEIKYETKSGFLRAKKEGSKISLDFPIDKALDYKLDKEFPYALGLKEFKKIIIGEKTKKAVIEVESKEKIIKLRPDFEKLKLLNSDNSIKGIGVTCRDGEKYDFISRYFNPWGGVNEDPVTGALHSLLASYWSSILNKREMIAYQASNRGGEILIELLEKDRVKLSGDSVIVLKGEINLYH